MIEFGLPLWYLLLLLWPALLWPAWRLRGAARAGLLAVALTGAAAASREAWVTFIQTPPASIRIDIFLIFAVLLAAYAVAAAILWRTGWRRTGAAFFTVVALVGIGFSLVLVSLSRESDRLTAAFEERERLLFEAGFRDRTTWESVFGPFGAAADSHPVGHWLAVGDGYLTRLIVNRDGRLWLYSGCYATECPWQSTGDGLRPGPENGWQAQLDYASVTRRAVFLQETGDGGLDVEFGDSRVAFAPAPPPLATEVALPAALTAPGSFVSLDCIRAHVVLRQIWLWREGENLYAVGVFRTFVHGEAANFVTPAVMGAGRRDGAGWSFAWRTEAHDWRATVEFDGAAPTLGLWRDGEDLGTDTLAPGAIFRDEAIDLAPLADAAAWSRWFAVMYIGRSLSADIPACR